MPNPRCVGGVTVGPPNSIQRKLSRPSAVRDQTIWTRPSTADSDPYFAALVESSRKEIAIVWAVFGSKLRVGRQFARAPLSRRDKAKAPAWPECEA